MITATDLGEVSLARALQGRLDEAEHVLRQVSTREREDLRRALTALLLLWGPTQEDDDG